MTAGDKYRVFETFPVWPSDEPIAPPIKQQAMPGTTLVVTRAEATDLLGMLVFFTIEDAPAQNEWVTTYGRFVDNCIWQRG